MLQHAARSLHRFGSNEFAEVFGEQIRSRITGDQFRGFVNRSKSCHSNPLCKRCRLRFPPGRDSALHFL